MISTSHLITSNNDVKSLQSEDLLVDQVGKTVAISLDRELKHLSPKVLNRLEMSRSLALSKQKISSKSSSNLTSKLDLFEIKSSINWFGMIVVTAIALYFVANWQQNSRIQDIADLDKALLSDSVPPDAYADEGFKVYLKEMIRRKDSEAEKMEAEQNTDKESVSSNENIVNSEAVKDASQNP